MLKLEVQYTFLDEVREKLPLNSYHEVVGYNFNNKQLVGLGGEPIVVDFDQQPPWCDIEHFEGRVGIPPFYVKRDNTSIFVSNQQIDGFSLHPAFEGGRRLWIIESVVLSDFSDITKKLPCEDLTHCDTCPLRFSCYTGGFKLMSYLTLDAVRILALIELRL